MHAARWPFWPVTLALIILNFVFAILILKGWSAPPGYWPMIVTFGWVLGVEFAKDWIDRKRRSRER
jgi:4-hydroxybenzoate polyprenyltransferase